MKKIWWIIGLGMMGVTAGCRFVEGPAEQRADTTGIPTASTAGPGSLTPSGTAVTPEPKTPEPTVPENLPATAPGPEEAAGPLSSDAEGESSAPDPAITAPAANEGESAVAPEAGPADDRSDLSPPEEEIDTSPEDPTGAVTEPASDAEAESSSSMGTEEDSEETVMAEASLEGPNPAPPLSEGEATPAEKPLAEALPEASPEPSGAAPDIAVASKKLAEALAEAKKLAEKETAEEPEEVPGGGVTPSAEKRVAQIPATAPSASEKEVKPKQAGEAEKTDPPKPEKETASTPGEEVTTEAESTEEAESPETDAQEQREAQQKAWEEAEATRKKQRQVTFGAVMHHLGQVEDALDGKKNDLYEALSGLQRMRRQLHFLRSQLTPEAARYHLDCAWALLTDNQVEAAQEQLAKALELTPVVEPSEESEETAAGETELPEAPEEGIATGEPESEAATEGEAATATASTAATEGEAVTTGEEESAGEEPEADEEEAPDLRQLVTSWSASLEAGTLEETKEAETLEETKQSLGQFLAEAPPSDTENLLEALDAEIDYTAEALARASRKAAEMEMASLRGNLEELSRLALGEAEATAGTSEGEMGLLGGLEEGEGSANSFDEWLQGETGGASDSDWEGTEGAPAAKEKLTSRLPAVLLGMLAIALLIRGRAWRRRG